MENPKRKQPAQNAKKNLSLKLPQFTQPLNVSKLNSRPEEDDDDQEEEEEK